MWPWKAAVGITVFCKGDEAEGTGMPVVPFGRAYTNHIDERDQVIDKLIY